jgi:hypothetical protein
MGLLRLAFVLVLAGCFNPALDGIYACRGDADCPDGLVCADDALCRGQRAVPGSVDASLDADPDSSADLASTDGVLSSNSDLSTLADLALTPGDLSMAPDLACVPRTKCNPGECGKVSDNCGGFLHCKKCDGQN